MAVTILGFLRPMDHAPPFVGEMEPELGIFLVIDAIFSMYASTERQVGGIESLNAVFVDDRVQHVLQDSSYRVSPMKGSERIHSQELGTVKAAPDQLLENRNDIALLTKDRLARVFV